jgi:hypothetical protein
MLKVLLVAPMGVRCFNFRLNYSAIVKSGPDFTDVTLKYPLN